MNLKFLLHKKVSLKTEELNELYKCDVLSVKDDVIEINSPNTDEAISFLREAKTSQMLFQKHKGSNVRQYEVSVLKYIGKNDKYPFPYIVLRVLKEEILPQNRLFYRANYPLDEDIVKIYKKNKLIHCVICDLSATGLKMRTNEEVKEGSILEIKVDTLCLKGEVLRINNLRDSNYKYEIGVRFFNYKKWEVDKLAKITNRIQINELSRLRQ
jgi:c-di-GMP-binding flagellar brake protein YcgR